MFFPDLITAIKNTDKVLEVGPGGNPHPRSDVLLERRYSTEEEAFRQRGNQNENFHGKDVVFYEGDVFPFESNSFDYVICSHVIEHVKDIDIFVAELCRVAPRGYIEFPLPTYELLYNFPDHLNYVSFEDGKITWTPKTEIKNPFESIQRFYNRSLEQGYTSLVDQLKPFLFFGVEWSGTMKTQRVNSLNFLNTENGALPSFKDSSWSQDFFIVHKSVITTLKNLEALVEVLKEQQRPLKMLKNLLRRFIGNRKTTL